MLYPISQLAAAATAATGAPFPTNTVRGWVGRGLLAHASGDQAAGTGVPLHLFSHQTAIQCIVMAELVRLGLAPGDAANAAQIFAHFGGGSGWGGKIDPQTMRNPGQCFPEGITWLVCWRANGVSENEDDFRGEVVNAELGVNPRPSSFHQASGALVILEMNDFLPRAREALGLPPIAAEELALRNAVRARKAAE